MSIHEDLLVADFGQCFEQMRHYDETFRRTLEFGFGGIAAVITASAALLAEYRNVPHIGKYVAALLLISSLVGSILLMSLAVNRVYFTRVARYVNEVRALYLRAKPGGILNNARMYSDYRFPPIQSLASGHSFQLYFLSICNSVLFTGFTYFAFWEGILASIIILPLASFIQIAGIVVYWSRMESANPPGSRESK